MERRKTRILCANCNLCINRLRRYTITELNARVSSIICNWVYPQIITDDDVICEECWQLAITAVNPDVKQENVSTVDEQHSGTIQRGHTSVCVLCGCSLLRKQSTKILRDNPTVLQESMIDIIKAGREPRQITASDKVCQSCWLRVKRQAIRQNRPKEEALQPIEKQEQPPENSQMPVAAAVASTNSGQVTLPDYRRAANTSSHCVFANCTSNGSLHTVSDVLRSVILGRHKYYIPKSARVCGDHLTGNLWGTLYDSENSLTTFTIDQLQHVFSFVDAFNPALDFNIVEEMDENIFEYWIGFSKQKFNDLLAELPGIREIRNGVLGLVAILLKQRTGDSNEKIAKLMGISRRGLESIMYKVREVLVGVSNSKISLQDS